MATEAELKAALIKAHNAGDTPTLPSSSALRA